MIKQSFKPEKCKTALKMALSQINELKNKKKVQVMQLKKEVAMLLAAKYASDFRIGPTARIWVEHVVWEETMMIAAYELIEIYSELILVRLPMIESQKNCPIDLKEAVASLFFASPRCADLPELMDVRKHFTAKYGEDFVTAAVDLHPDCGVSHRMVVILTYKALDGPKVNDHRKAASHSQNVSPELEKRNSAGLNKTPIVDVASDVDDDHLERPSVEKQHISRSSRGHRHSQTSSRHHRHSASSNRSKRFEEVNNIPIADGHFHNVSPELEERNNLRRDGLKKKPIGDVASEVDDGKEFESDDVKKQHISLSSQGHSQTSSRGHHALSNRSKTVAEVNDDSMADRHSQKGSHELEKIESLHQASLKKKSIRSEIDIASDVEFRMELETSDYLEEAKVRKPSTGDHVSSVSKIIYEMSVE